MKKQNGSDYEEREFLVEFPKFFPNRFILVQNNCSEIFYLSGMEYKFKCHMETDYTDKPITDRTIVAVRCNNFQDPVQAGIIFADTIPPEQWVLVHSNTMVK